MHQKGCGEVSLLVAHDSTEFRISSGGVDMITEYFRPCDDRDHRHSPSRSLRDIERYALIGDARQHMLPLEPLRGRERAPDGVTSESGSFEHPDCGPRKRGHSLRVQVLGDNCGDEIGQPRSSETSVSLAGAKGSPGSLHRRA
jgi:hypothetical protein